MKKYCLLSLFALLMSALFTSCSDDEIDIHMLDGKWSKVYPENVSADGYVEYEFQAKEYVHGTFTGNIYVYSVRGGDIVIPFNWIYGDAGGGKMELTIELVGDAERIVQSYTVEKLDKKTCRLVSTYTGSDGNPYEIINLRRK